MSIKVVAAIALCLLATLGVVTAETKTIDWRIQDYSPLEAKVGDTLLFNWSNDVHDVVEVATADCMGEQVKRWSDLMMDGPVSVPLTKAGTFTYICTAYGHCSFGMLITVTVTAASAAPPPTGSPRIAKALLLGSKQLPAVATKAQGYTTVTTVNSTHYLLRLRITKPIQNYLYSHIHAGNATTSGPVILNIFPAQGAASPPINGTFLKAIYFDASSLQGEYANNRTKFQGALDYLNLYVNVHTTQNPAGEIRGQLHYNS